MHDALGYHRFNDGQEAETCMCGIVGILGIAPVARPLLDALQRLEYRGYNSAGVATHRRTDGSPVGGPPESCCNLEAVLAREPLAGTAASGTPAGPHTESRPRTTRIRTRRPTSRSCTTASSRTSANCVRSWSASRRRFADGNRHGSRRPSRDRGDDARPSTGGSGGSGSPAAARCIRAGRFCSPARTTC